MPTHIAMPKHISMPKHMKTITTKRPYDRKGAKEILEINRERQGRALAHPTKASQNDAKVRLQWKVCWAEWWETARLPKQGPEPRHGEQSFRVRGRFWEVGDAQASGVPRQIPGVVVQGPWEGGIEKST